MSGKAVQSGFADEEHRAYVIGIAGYADLISEVAHPARRHSATRSKLKCKKI